MKQRDRKPIATKEEIERMKALHSHGWSVRQLAEKFGISKSAIHRYITGKVGYGEIIDPIDE